MVKREANGDQMAKKSGVRDLMLGVLGSHGRRLYSRGVIREWIHILEGPLGPV